MLKNNTAGTPFK